jgi:hypothetical protein
MTNTQSDEGPQLGSTDHPQHRAPEGEGIRSDSPNQYSIFDGEGNEVVVTVHGEQEGERTLATGPTAAESAQTADKSDEVGEGFFPPPGH